MPRCLDAIPKQCPPGPVGPAGQMVARGHKPNSVPAASISRRRKRATIIRLRPPLPTTSSTLPVLALQRWGPADHGLPDCIGNEDCLRLHAVGFTVPRLSPAERCALTAPFHPCLCPDESGPSAVCFLWHCPWPRNQEPVGVTHHRVLSCSDFPPSTALTAIVCPRGIIAGGRSQELGVRS